MTDNPITSPPELVKQWGDDILNDRENVDVVLDCAWKDGYRAGARAARRPKPRSLAEEALITLEQTVILLMPLPPKTATPGRTAPSECVVNPVCGLLQRSEQTASLTSAGVAATHQP